MNSHTVYIRLVNVDALGNIVDRDDPGTTLGMMAKTSVEPRILPDPTVSNSAGYPTIKDYIQAEGTAGFRLAHMDNTTIVTQSS